MMTKRFSLIFVLFTFLVVAVVSFILMSWDVQWDLKSDQRYTLSPLAKEMVRETEEPLIITILMEGDRIPATFRNYRSYIDYYVSELRRYDNDVVVLYKDPSEGSREEVRSFKKFLASENVVPIRREAASADELSVVELYPYLSIHNTEQIQFVNLLEPQVMGEGEEERLLRSQLTFEGKFLRAMRHINRDGPLNIQVLGYRTDLLSDGYNRDQRLSGFQFYESNANALMQSQDSIAAILVVLKKEDLARQELLAVDIISGRGVPIIWMIDKYDTTIDSLRMTGAHIAAPKEYTVEDYLFRTGVRIKPELILDLQSSFIPQVVNDGGASPETRMLKYPYHPLIISTDESDPAVKLSTPLAMYFVSPVEILEYPESTSKSPLLITSPYTKIQPGIVSLDFGLMNIAQNPAAYQQGAQLIGVRINGHVAPYFKNRLMTADKELLDKHDILYSRDSQIVNQIVIADTDFAIPTSDNTGRYYPVGYNPEERQMYDANVQLLSNLIESLVDGNDILEMSQKESSLAVLDIVKFRSNATMYYFFLLGIPLILLIATYAGYMWYRKKKYAA